MPLPLPNLDTRRWADLVEEGRALIPPYSPDWTDHNLHDPGITLIELFAWLIEQEIYRVNRVPERHQRKFLALIGFNPAPPCAARTVVSFTLRPGATPVTLPTGTLLETEDAHGQPLLFRTLEDVTVVPAALTTIRVDDGTTASDRTHFWREGQPILVLGAEPSSTTLYLGFDQPLPPDIPVSLWLRFQGPGTDFEERERLIREMAEQATDPSAFSTNLTFLHHSARTVWEFADEGESGWQLLNPDAGEIEDNTRALTLDGRVRIRLPAAMKRRSLGNEAKEYYYLRCRGTGQYDATPVLLGAVMNAVAVEQAVPVWQTSPAAADNGEPTLELCLGKSNGRPLQHFTLPQASVQDGTLRLWTLEANACWVWEQRSDLDASRRTDRHFTLNATTGEIIFGDGEQGQIPPPETPILASYCSTRGRAGNIPADALWKLVDNAYNRALLASFETTRDALDKITNSFPAAGGADTESLEQAAGRAAAALWAHERLVELCPRADCTTLDQLDRAEVLARSAPLRATTPLDFERLALDVPGTRVVRARAWADMNPNFPGRKAPGTVTIVIVPELPHGRPCPSPGLLQTVHRYLERRKIIGTRLVVVGPQYLEVKVWARIRARAGARSERVCQDVIKALNTFLDPLQGGPNGRGWPFGRNVYLSEILQVIDEVPGVDHVLELKLIPDKQEARSESGNLNVEPTWLVTPGRHTIEVDGILCDE